MSKPKANGGWKKVGGAHKVHFFPDLGLPLIESLCRQWVTTDPWLGLATTLESKACKECLRKHEKLFE